MVMSTKAFCVAVSCTAIMFSGSSRGEGIDTEHLFAFMIGSDVGDKGEHELQSQSSAAFGKAGGRYRSAEQELELELVPVDNFRIEIGTAFSGHDINGVTGLDDRRQLGWQGGALDLRYRLLGRDTAGVGMTVSLQSEASRLDDTTEAAARQYGAMVTVAFDKEILAARAVAALNLFYRPEWTSFSGASDTERDATVGAATAVMAQVAPGVLLGGEARYLRKYDGVGLNGLSGQALFVGPTAYIQLSQRSRLTMAWSSQVWGRMSGVPGVLDLANFERHQARLIFGLSF